MDSETIALWLQCKKSTTEVTEDKLLRPCSSESTYDTVILLTDQKAMTKSIRYRSMIRNRSLTFRTRYPSIILVGFSGTFSSIVKTCFSYRVFKFLHLVWMGILSTQLDSDSRRKRNGLRVLLTEQVQYHVEQRRGLPRNIRKFELNRNSCRREWGCI